LLSAGLGTAVVFSASLSACGTVIDRSPLLAAALIAGCGSLRAAGGTFVALGQQSVLIRSVVALWALAFYLAALLALNYVLSLFLHCAPS